MISEGAMSDWSGIYFVKVVKPDAAWVTVGFTAYVCTMATGRFVGDWVAFKLGIKRMLQVSGLLMTSGLLLAVLFPQFITATIGFLIGWCGCFLSCSDDIQRCRKIQNHVAGCSHSGGIHHWLSWIPIRSAFYRIYCAGYQSANILRTDCHYGSHDCGDGSQNQDINRTDRQFLPGFTSLGPHWVFFGSSLPPRNPRWQ